MFIFILLFITFNFFSNKTITISYFFIFLISLYLLARKFGKLIQFKKDPPVKTPVEIDLHKTLTYDNGRSCSCNGDAKSTAAATVMTEKFDKNIKLQAKILGEVKSLRQEIPSFVSKNGSPVIQHRISREKFNDLISRRLNSQRNDVGSQEEEKFASLKQTPVHRREGHINDGLFE